MAVINGAATMCDTPRSMVDMWANTANDVVIVHIIFTVFYSRQSMDNKMAIETESGNGVLNWHSILRNLKFEKKSHNFLMLTSPSDSTPFSEYMMYPDATPTKYGSTLDHGDMYKS